MPIDAAELDALFAPLVEEAARDLGARRLPAAIGSTSSAGWTCATPASRYELAVPMATGFRDEFDCRHARTYGYADPTPARSRW